MQSRLQDGELFWEKEEKAHSETITDLQVSEDGTYFVTSSKDKSAKVRPSPSSPTRGRINSSPPSLPQSSDLVGRTRQELFGGRGLPHAHQDLPRRHPTQQRRPHPGQAVRPRRRRTGGDGCHHHIGTARAL